MKMNTSRWILLLFVAGFCLLEAAETRTPSDNALLGLFHHSGGMRDFRARAVAMVDGTKEVLAKHGYPEFPTSYWEELKQEISVNDYGVWWSSVMRGHLNATDVAALTDVLGSEEKNELLIALGKLSGSKKGPELQHALDEWRDRKGADLVNEILRVGRTSFVKFQSALSEVKQGEQEIMVRLCQEADKRVRARRK